MASILVFGPHPDDQELGMGGTIIKLARQGHKVHIVDMTNGEPTPLGSVETRAKEAAAAAKVLGVERTLLGLTNREVVHALESRHKLAAVIRKHQADWLFVPVPDRRASGPRRRHEHRRGRALRREADQELASPASRGTPSGSSTTSARTCG